LTQHEEGMTLTLVGIHRTRLYIGRQSEGSLIQGLDNPNTIVMWYESFHTDASNRPFTVN